MRCIILLSFLFFSTLATAQVGIGTINPNTSAALDIADTSRGILIPRLTLNQRTAIASPAEGLMVYQTNGAKGFWYFDGGQWVKSGVSSNPFTGKNVIIIADSITNAQAHAKIAAELGTNTQEIRITGCANLTSIDLSAVIGIVDLYIWDNPVLQSVNLSNLISCDGFFEIYKCPVLTQLDLSSLQAIVGVLKNCEILNTGLVNISFPSLKNITGELLIHSNPNLVSVAAPSLKKAGSLMFQNNDIFTSALFPELSSAGNIYFYRNNSLASVSFSSLSEIKANFFLSQNTNLSSVTLSNLSVLKAQNFNVSYNKLPGSQVNTILNKLVSITPSITGKTINIDGQSPLAQPTGQGIIDKNTLITNGNTVTTD